MAAPRSLRWGTPVMLVASAAVGWWWSARMASDMTSPDATDMDGMSGMDGMGGDALSLGAFIVAWLAMMTAMMFPAITPVVKLYGRAAAAGRVAPLPFFVAGYIAVWTSIGLPAYFAWRALMDPVAEARPWAGRLAGLVLVAAAAWQLTPLKSVCLRHCRSPISFFLRFGAKVARPAGALRMGATHGVFCVGCCWALMAVLVAMGTMNLAWMAMLSLLIIVEKNAPAGERVASLAAVAFAVGGVLLLVRPETLTTLT
jgi:predicted metal-binding membrane protein